MKRNSKRFLSLALVAPMVLSLAATPVYAAPADPSAAAAAEAQEALAEAQKVQEGTTQESDQNADAGKDVQADADKDVQADADKDVQADADKDAQTDADKDAQTDADKTEKQNDAETEAAQEKTQSSEASKKAAQPETFTVNADGSDINIDVSGIKVSHINVNQPAVSTLAQIDENDPQIQTFRAELEDAEVTDEDTGDKVALTDEQIQTALGMFSQYVTYREEHADIFGVQNPFYLQFNDNGEDGLGVLGEMLTLAGVSVDDVRSGNYSYDDLLGMIMNFQYGDQFGYEYYHTAIAEKRDDALKTVEESGAQTDEQKLLVLNTWLAQHNTFDMSYIMNQMDPDNPIMTAEDQQPNEHYNDIYAAMEQVYRPQIEAQFQAQFQTVAQQQVELGVYKNAIQQVVVQSYKAQNPDATDDDANAYAEQYMTENAEAISTDPKSFITQNFGEETATAVETQVNEFMASDDGKAAVDSAYNTIMDTSIPDLGNMTPNEAIEVYVQQAASGLTNGIIGYWEGTQVGALAEGASVCMGYAKAYAYLVQCLYPEYYLKDGATDITDPSNWKKPSEIYYDADGNLDINADYNVDLVRISFNASVKMYGIPQPDFSSDHFWNAVKVNGQWYYIDPCYIDVFSEVMNRDRVETDGYMNHIYFLISHTSIAEMFEGNYKEIKSLYADAATDQSYEGTWFSRIASNVYTDDGYAYYTYDSTDLLSMMREFNSSDGNYQNMEVDPTIYKLVRHKMTSNDKAVSDGDTDYETLIDFNSGDKVTVLQNGEMVENDMLTELYSQFAQDQDIYPAIHITTVFYNGKAYFNLANCIISYDLSTGEVTKVKEYNTVYAQRDPQVVFGAMAFSTTDSADNADFTFENHPIAGISLKDDGKLYVNIATNLSYIAGKDPHDYTDSSSYGYEFEESNYNPDYNEYTDKLIADEGMSDETLEQLGYKRETNDNSEFMWVANVTDTMDMSHFAGTSHTYEEVSVDPTCGENGFTENRCTTCGAIEDGTRTEEEGTACDHHYLLFKEQYYTTSDDVTADTDPSTVNWNTGESYVCARCGFAISEPTEPKENSWGGNDNYEEEMKEYEEQKAIYDEAVATAGHTYAPTDAEWSEDGTKVTFSNLACTSVCESRKNSVDLLLNDDTISASLSTPVTADAKVTSTEGTCAEGLTVTYSASGTTDDGMKWTASTTKQLDPGQHSYTGDFVWTPVKDDEGNVTGYTATATLTCSVCGDVQKDVEAVVTKDEAASVEPTEDADGQNVYTATATVTDADGNVLGSVSATKTDKIPALGQKDDFTGLRKMDDNNWYYFVNGEVQKDYTGLVKHTTGSWYYVANGKVDFNKEGLIKHVSGSWYYVKGGKMQSSYTGLVKHTTGSWYYVANGKVDFNKTGLVKHVSGSWYYVKDGKMQSSYTGLVKHTTGSWYYVANGKVDFNKTGLVKHTSGRLYYVEKGKWNSHFNGTAKYNGKNYTVKNGVNV